MNVLASAGSSTGRPGWSGGTSSGAAAAVLRCGPPPGAGFGGVGDRIAVQMASPDNRKNPTAAAPVPVSRHAVAVDAPRRDAPHSEQNFAAGEVDVPHCGQGRAGIDSSRIITEGGSPSKPWQRD